VPFLGAIPLDPGAHELADGGTPLVVGNPNSAASRAFLALAEKVAQTVERERRAREREADEAALTAHQAFWERLLDD
jgi:ATP-binding protein involved in chromosome partitioning